MAFASRSRSTTSLGRLVFDLALNLLLIGLLICGALYIEPAISGKSEGHTAAVLFGTLLPIGTLILLSGIERLFPAAGPRKSLGTFLLHLQLNIFQYFLGGIAA